MPIYRFQCDKCELSFEELVKMGTTETTCKCGETAKKDFRGSLMFASTGLPNGFSSIRSTTRQP